MPYEILKMIPLLHHKTGTLYKHNICFNILVSEDDCLLGCCAFIRVMIIALMMGAASASETSVNFYQTSWHNNPEDSHLHAHFC
jgi:hypothetical protein